MSLVVGPSRCASVQNLGTIFSLPGHLLVVKEGLHLQPPHFFLRALDQEGASAARAGDFVDRSGQFGGKDNVCSNYAHSLRP